VARPHGGATGLRRFIDFIDENGGGRGSVYESRRKSRISHQAARSHARLMAHTSSQNNETNPFGRPSGPKGRAYTSESSRRIEERSRPEKKPIQDYWGSKSEYPHLGLKAGQ
jgi:hypothetical protein